MAVEASIVVDFGDGAPGDDELVVVEFNEDHSNNLDSDGEVKNSFRPGEQPVFMVNHSPALRIESVKCTDGSVRLSGNNLTKERDKEVLFTTLESKDSLGYSEPVLTTIEWFGNTGNLIINNSQAELVTGTIPCLGHVTYDVVFNSEYILTPPTLSLEGDETYKIVVVIYMERI